MRMELNTRCALARPHKRPASEELSIFPIIFDPRGRMGGLFTKNRTSAATVKRTGPEVVPATMCSSGYTRIIVPAGMLIEQDVSLGLAKAIEVRHDKPRKTAASIVLFVAFILAFLLFLGLSHFNDPLPTTGFVGRRAAISVARVGSATQGDFSPAWKFLGTIVAVVLRNVRLNQQGPPRCSAIHAAKPR